MSNLTLQNWSDTTINQKIQINTGAILTKASYFNFVVAKGYVENQRALGLNIDPNLLKQAFYEGLIQGEVSNDGTFRNGLDANEAAFIADNFIYHGTGLIRDDSSPERALQDQLTVLSRVEAPSQMIIISSGSNNIEDYVNNNSRTAVGLTTGSLSQDIDALTGMKSNITFGGSLDINNTFSFYGITVTVYFYRHDLFFDLFF